MLLRRGDGVSSSSSSNSSQPMMADGHQPSPLEEEKQDQDAAAAALPAPLAHRFINLADAEFYTSEEVANLPAVDGAASDSVPLVASAAAAANPLQHITDLCITQLERLFQYQQRLETSMLSLTLQQAQVVFRFHSDFVQETQSGRGWTKRLVDHAGLLHYRPTVLRQLLALAQLHQHLPQLGRIKNVGRTMLLESAAFTHQQIIQRR